MLHAKVLSVADAVKERVLLILNRKVDDGHVGCVEGISCIQLVKVELGEGDQLTVGIDDVAGSLYFFIRSQTMRQRKVVDFLSPDKG